MLIGCYFFVETIFFRGGLFDRLVYLTFGIAVVGIRAAELLPRDRRRLAGLLRVGGVVLLPLAVLVRLAQLFGSAV